MKVLKGSDGVINISTPFWEVGLNPYKGGAIERIIFFNGSNDNILTKPIYTSVDGYMDINDSSADCSITENSGNVELNISGELKNKNGIECGISFRQKYLFKEEYIKVKTDLIFNRDLEAAGVEVGSTYLSPELSCHVCRSPGNEDKSYMNFSASKDVLINEKNVETSRHFSVPLNMYYYNRFVEGIEFQPDSNIFNWDNNFSDSGCDGLYYSRKTDEGIYVRRSPLFVKVPRKIKKGIYTFGYYIGLPKIYDKSPRKWNFVMAGKKPWISDEQIALIAQNGINLLLIQNDFSEDGDFWRDGCYPPFDEYGMNEMKRVIASCHKNNIKVMTYFSLYELHPEAPGFENVRLWCREPYKYTGSSWWKMVKDGAIYNPVKNGFFGAQMCLASSWRDKLKKNIEIAYRDLGLDGIYYDYVTNSYCENMNHSPYKHTTIDGLIDILEWTRNLVGKDGIMALHIQGSNPGIIFENFADTVITMEEIAFPVTGSEGKIIYRIPELHEIPVFAAEGEVVQRSLCPAIVNKMDDKIIASKRFIAECASLGFLTYLFNNYGLKYAKDILSLGLQDYYFKNVYSGIVDTGTDTVKGAVYYNENDAKVFIINISGEYLYGIKFKIDIEKLNWKSTDGFVISNMHTGEENLVHAHASTHLCDVDIIEPYQYVIFDVKRIGF